MRNFLELAFAFLKAFLCFVVGAGVFFILVAANCAMSLCVFGAFVGVILSILAIVMNE